MSRDPLGIHKGRPTAYSTEIRNILIGALEVGNYTSTACEVAGIDNNTFLMWLQYAKRDRLQNVTTVFTEFADDVRKAMAQSEMHDLETIRIASASQWQAAAWRLERRFREKWGKQERVDLHAKVDVNARTELLKILDGIAEQAPTSEVEDATEDYGDI